MKNFHEIASQEALEDLYNGQTDQWTRYAFQEIDFNKLYPLHPDFLFNNCMFMGCKFPHEMTERMDKDCLVFPTIELPYRPFTNTLYSAASLYAGYQMGMPESYQKCFDNRVYQHYLNTGKNTENIKESLARALHDNSITDAMEDFIHQYDERQVIGIMGGHSLLRTDPMYHQIAKLGKLLTEKGFLLITGGGPGAMEATHLGAWMAGRKNEELAEALQTLQVAPAFTDKRWLDTAFEVITKYPQINYCSLGIPTWLYGHEPATPFATHIAKYFENSIREDKILTWAMGGIIYSPGSAGTLQEIFQDAVQNHYLSCKYSSPMIFMGTNYWTKEMPIYPLLQHLLKTQKYKHLRLSLTDNNQEIIKVLTDFRNESDSIDSL